MNTNSVLYSLKVWLTSVVLAPVIYLIISVCQSQNHYLSSFNFISEQVSTYVMFLLAGGLLSFITWILFIFIIKIITLYFQSVNIIKSIVAISGVLLTFGTFAVFMPMPINPYNDFFYLILAYGGCIAGGAYFYKLEISQLEPDV